MIVLRKPARPATYESSCGGFFHIGDLMNNTSDKPFLTYEAQIQKLIDKGLTIHDYGAAVALLKNTVILR